MILITPTMELRYSFVFLLSQWLFVKSQFHCGHYLCVILFIIKYLIVIYFLSLPNIEALSLALLAFAGVTSNKH